MSIILLLAAQAAGQEITTFHPLPSQEKAEAQQVQAQQANRPVEAKAEAQPQPQVEPAPPKPPEKIEVLSVRKVSPNANVVFVPPPDEPR